MVLIHCKSEFPTKQKLDLIFLEFTYTTNLNSLLTCIRCRYIPVGVLERVPQRINEKPPYYVGRDDLETLMASGNCADWVKIRSVAIRVHTDPQIFLNVLDFKYFFNYP